MFMVHINLLSGKGGKEGVEVWIRKGEREGMRENFNFIHHSLVKPDRYMYIYNIICPLQRESKDGANDPQPKQCPPPPSPLPSRLTTVAKECHNPTDHLLGNIHAAF